MRVSKAIGAEPFRPYTVKIEVFDKADENAIWLVGNAAESINKDIEEFLGADSSEDVESLQEKVRLLCQSLKNTTKG